MDCSSKLAKRTKRGCNGFTLIEILIVVAIIGIIAAIAIPGYFRHIDRARITVSVATLDSTRTAIEEYFNEHSKYPAAIDFTSGKDDLGRTVISGELLQDFQEDLFTVDSYVPALNDYTMTAQVNNTERTMITMTPQEISY